MRLVQHDYDAELVLAGQFLDVLADAAMKRGKAGVRLQSHPDRDLAVEVAAVDGGVVRVVEAVASLGEIFLQGAQETGLATTRVSGDDGGGPSFDCGLERLQSFLQLFGLEHVRGSNVLGERLSSRAIGGKKLIHDRLLPDLFR